MSAAPGIQYKRKPQKEGLEMLKSHGSILSEVRFDPFTQEDSNVEETAMPCMEIVDSDN